MKKILLAAVIITLTGFTYALDFSLSAGGGGLLGYTFTRYTLKGGNATSVQSMDRINYAGFLFFDAAYAELSVLIQGGYNSYTEKMTDLPAENGTGSEISLGFSLLGKYPFNINETISWFPMLGVEYQIALKQRRKPDDGVEYNRSNGKGNSATDVDKNGNSYPLSAFNSFWIDVGAGLDYNFTGSLFLRTELLFGFRLPTSYEMGALEMAKKSFNIDNPKLRGLTGSPNIKIGIGYRF